MTRRLGLLVAVLVFATAVTATLLVVSEWARTTEPEAAPPETSNLVLLAVEIGGSPVPVVAGGTGFGYGGAVIVPPETVITVPGQGESTVADALGLPPRQAATAIANLLGVWLDDHASIDGDALAEVADRAGGIELDGETADADDVGAFLERLDDGVTMALRVVLDAVLRAPVAWDDVVFADAERPGRVARALASVSGSSVVTLEVRQVEGGAMRATPEDVTRALVDAFGGPREPAVPVIVLNGNGVPGVGEAVAERILPGGFRVAVSQNASTFDHLETLVVVGSPDDVALGERVRDLLGVGRVSVSVGSGIAPVTVVVGKDFIG